MRTTFKRYSKTKTLWCFITIVISFCSNIAIAQDNGLEVKAQFQIQQNSNIYQAKDAIEDSVAQFRPQLQYSRSDGVSSIQAMYQGDYTHFKDTSNLSYSEHEILLNVASTFSYALSGEVSLNFINEIEQPGENNALAIILDEFNQRSGFNVSTKLFYGTTQSTGQFLLNYVHEKLDYDNNQQNFRDFNKNSVTGTFLFRISTQTRLIAETTQAKLNSTSNNAIDRSSNQSTYLGGVEWGLTDTATSSFKMGYQKVSYEDITLVDLSGLSYSLNVNWKLNTHSLFKLGASRSARESAEQSIGGFIANNLNIGLVYDVSDDAKLNLGYIFTSNNFDDTQPRKDKSHNLTARFNYKLNYWLQLYTEAAINKRSSSFNIYDYDANVLSLGLSVSFDKRR